MRVFSFRIKVECEQSHCRVRYRSLVTLENQRQRILSVSCFRVTNEFERQWFSCGRFTSRYNVLHFSNPNCDRPAVHLIGIHFAITRGVPAVLHEFEIYLQCHQNGPQYFLQYSQTISYYSKLFCHL